MARSKRRVRSYRDRKRGSSKRVVIWTFAIVLIFVIAAGAWVGIRALLAKSELEAAVPLASELKAVALKGDSAEISKTASQLHRHASTARDLTSDPIWRAAEIVPVLGPNLTAARELSAVVSSLSTDAVGPLTRLVASIDLADFKPVDGTIDLRPLSASGPSVAQATASLKKAESSLAEINTSATVDAVSDAVDRLRTQVKELVPAVTALSNAVELLPSMLGASEPRNYLLIFQNPAELRSSGGIPGAMALVHTDNGQIELQQQSSSSEFPRYEAPVLELPTETAGLFGRITGEYIQDINLTPDFSLTAKLAQRMWSERYGTDVDGVISIDPVALSYILEATGPVEAASGETLTSDNAVSTLLNEAYIRFPVPAQQDAFFAASAKAVFDKVSAGDLDPVTLIASLSKAGAERRILVWNQRDEEQRILAGTSLTGALPGETDQAPQIGVFLNDATGAKMDYYLNVDTSIGSVTCRADGRKQIGVSVTLTNGAPADAATSLPDYITGGGAFGVPVGNIRTSIALYGAPGLINLGVAGDGGRVDTHSATDSERPVSQVDVELAPGESRTFVFGFLGDDREMKPSDVQTTPFINMNETSELALTCESDLW